MTEEKPVAGCVTLRYKVTNFLGDATHRTTPLTPEKADEVEAYLTKKHGEFLVWCKREPVVVDIQAVEEMIPIVAPEEQKLG